MAKRSITDVRNSPIEMDLVLGFHNSGKSTAWIARRQDINASSLGRLLAQYDAGELEGYPNRKDERSQYRDRANREFQLAKKSLLSTVEHAAKCGHWLRMVKEHTEIKHGEWGPWIEIHFEGSKRTAERWMQLAYLLEEQGLLRGSKASAQTHLNELPQSKEGQVLEMIHLLAGRKSVEPEEALPPPPDKPKSGAAERFEKLVGTLTIKDLLGIEAEAFDRLCNLISQVKAARTREANGKRPVSPKSQAGKVLAYLKSCNAHGATDLEIAKALELKKNSATPRRIELVDKGLVKPSGTKRDRCCVWVAVVEP